jgi:hypothetical protein
VRERLGAGVGLLNLAASFFITLLTLAAEIGGVALSLQLATSVNYLLFVLNMTIDPNDAAIVRSTIELAHNLGLQLVAEGVEDQETLELLAALGCDLAQGYHLARPMPADDVADLGRQFSLG